MQTFCSIPVVQQTVTVSRKIINNVDLANGSLNIGEILIKRFCHHKCLTGEVFPYVRPSLPLASDDDPSISGAPCLSSTQSLGSLVSSLKLHIPNSLTIERRFVGLRCKIAACVEDHHGDGSAVPMLVQTILLERERIKRDTIRNRRLQHQKNAA
jgi:hypothetical protein